MARIVLESTRREENANLNAVIPISKVVHRLELLIDNPNTGFVCANGDVLDVFCRLALLLQLGVDMLGGFDGGLRMELGCESRLTVTSDSWSESELTRIGHLEENIFHYVASIRSLELKLLALE